MMMVKHLLRDKQQLNWLLENNWRKHFYRSVTYIIFNVFSFYNMNIVY